MMTLTLLSLKEWQRRPLRAAITAAGVAIATAACFSLATFQRGYRAGFHEELERLGAHILLVPKGCPYDAASMALHGASWPCYLRERYLQEVVSVPGIAAAAPVFMAALYNRDSTRTVYVGVERTMLALRPGWQITGHFPEREGELLVGSEAARQSGWTLGAQVPLPGLDGRQGRVVGVLAPTQGADDTFVHVRLADAQHWFRHTNELTHILVKLSDPDQLDRAVSQLRGCDAGLVMNVVPVAQVFRTIQSLVSSTRVFLAAIGLVALLAAGAGVSNTILMAVSERQRDIGLMRAMGASRAHIFRLVWLETMWTCLSGATVGLLVAFLASRVIEAWVRSKLAFAPASALIRWEWGLAVACLGGVVLLGSFAGFIPAWRATVIPPLAAMRRNGGWA
jgi:putative ABC transport system permease protein